MGLNGREGWGEERKGVVRREAGSWAGRVARAGAARILRGMPELAEVEHHRRRWNPGLGARVRSVEVHARARVFRGIDVVAMQSRLRGATLLESMAHGKQMMFRFSRGAWLGVHLGMTGELRCEPGEVEPGKHDHLVLRQDGRALVFADPRLFGRIRFELGEEAPAWWRSLPPALLSPDFTAGVVGAFFRRRARAPIKAVLLQQERFPGVGNWMADEILWRAGVHPRTPAGRLVSEEAAARLWSEIRWVTEGAMRIVAADYSDPPATWLFPHRWRDGGRCPRDGGPLERAEIGGRTTAWCPRCQAGSGRSGGIRSAAGASVKKRSRARDQNSLARGGRAGRMAL